MKRHILTTVLVCLIALASCMQKDKISPDLQAVLGPVEFENSFTINTTTPNFTNGDKVIFTAKFKEDAYWVITIVGANSGAIKTFEGTGTFISASNAMWDGTANALPSFRAEAVTATLTFPKSSNKPTASFSITIGGKRNADFGHVLVTDFNTNKIANGNPGANTNVLWPSDWSPTGVNGTNDLPYINPDDSKFCTIGPAGAWQPNADFVGHNSPYIDFLTISANSLGYPTYFPLIADPSKIYFNIMVYNDVLPTNTWLDVTLHEDHPSIAGTTVGKTLTIKPNWNTGWKLISVNYLDFNLPDTTMTLNNPQKIKDIQLVLLSNAKQDVLDAGTSPVSATFDHLIFTHYKPYQP